MPNVTPLVGLASAVSDLPLPTKGRHGSARSNNSSKENRAQSPRQQRPQSPRQQRPQSPRQQRPQSPRQQRPQSPRKERPQSPRQKRPQSPRRATGSKTSAVKPALASLPVPATTEATAFEMSPLKLHEPSTDRTVLHAKRQAEMLQDAAACGSLEAVTDLLNESAQASMYIDHGLGEGATTALMVAAQAGHVDIVHAFLAAGAEVDMQDSLGRSALIFAAANGESALFAPLVERGADPQLRADNGWNAMSFASVLGHHEAVGQLVELSAKGGLPDTMSMQSALGLARMHEQPVVVALLEILLEQEEFDLGRALMLTQEKWRAAGMKPRMEMTVDDPLPGAR